MSHSSKPIKNINQIAVLKDYLKQDNKRNYILFMVGIYTWLKLEDILHLRVGDVKGESINIREMSTRKTQRVLMNPNLKEVISPFIKDKSDNQYLFTNSRDPDAPLSETEALEVLGKAAAKVGIVKFDQDTMRKTFAYAFYKLGVEIRLLKEILGQPSIESVLDYIDWSDYPFFYRRFGEVR